MSLQVFTACLHERVGIHVARQLRHERDVLALRWRSDPKGTSSASQRVHVRPCVVLITCLHE